MSGNVWIILGLLAGAFSAYAIQHGFSLRDTSRPTFSLADCTFDMVFQIPDPGLQTFRKALPQDNGSLTVQLKIAEEGVNQQYAHIQLTGRWNGTSGFIPQYSEDLIVFNLSDRRFFLSHKKPIIESVPATLTRLSEGKRYSIEMIAFPGFAIPLVPEKFQMRTHDGVLYTITNFSGTDKGWYSATLAL